MVSNASCVTGGLKCMRFRAMVAGNDVIYIALK